MLNQIIDKTEVTAHSEVNLTTFTVEIGLHPKDVQNILDIICDQLRVNCDRTKKAIEALNKEPEYLKDLFNLK